jgi:hypothetical protein
MRTEKQGVLKTQKVGGAGVSNSARMSEKSFMWYRQGDEVKNPKKFRIPGGDCFLKEESHFWKDRGHKSKRSRRMSTMNWREATSSSE